MNTYNKVLLVTFSNISDHQDKVVVLYEEMKKLGVDVNLLLPEKIDVKCEKSDRTIFLKCPERPGITRGTFNLINLYTMLRKVKEGRYRFIFFETLHIWNLPIMLLFRKKIKIYQMIHDVIPHGGDKTAKQVDLMNKVVCKLADKIIICNKKYKKELCKRYKISPKRVYNMELWERYPIFHESNKNGHMLFFGRLNPYKGADNLLKIVKRCKNIHFDVVGKADSQVAGILDELKKCSNVNVDERYVADNEVDKIFRQCEWVLLPYNSATQSGIVVESYKNSKPVISFDVGAIAEQIVDGETGFLVKASDIEGFIDKIKEANLTTEERYKQYCKAAYNYGFEKFSPYKAAKRLKSLCK